MTKQAKIIIFLCLYVLGIITFLSAYSALFIPAVIITAVFCLLKNILPSKLLFTFIFAFVLGFFNSSIHLFFDDDLTPYSGKNITVKAKVQTIPANNIKDRTKFYAKISSIEADDDITS
ncbi:MAG: hypothetical protein LUH05_02435, partial [Candidatus Gastranaerophilales bacterium]|nr:hypothetical protein [Candidatus Gastranaerophilales bacterium]